MYYASAVHLLFWWTLTSFWNDGTNMYYDTIEQFRGIIGLIWGKRALGESYTRLLVVLRVIGHSKLMHAVMGG